MMKNLIYSLFVMICFSSLSIAQETGEVVVSQGKQELLDSKTNGEYQFTFVDQTAERIEKSASYYTHYFTVAYDESSMLATITMIQNDEKGRAVIMRFLSASGARFVEVDDNVISVSEFMVDFL